ncbi:putative phage tail protein [Chromobacterium sp. Beijing]|uniref:putative phage tail protein n=1 Tax=Chromobacterium sp. Beijing TaxID=2735795 RepID=UPI001F26E512|nr:putative phage tail protein [Chromobacterium sp. Beijing]
MNHDELLTLLLPPTSYAAATGGSLEAELSAEGNALDVVQASARSAVGGVTPFLSQQMLLDWERVCGITPAANAPYQQRLQTVLAKLAEIGGLSIPYFIRLAAGLGYQITINEPQPFRAGLNCAGIHFGLLIFCGYGKYWFMETRLRRIGFKRGYLLLVRD